MRLRGNERMRQFLHTLLRGLWVESGFPFRKYDTAKNSELGSPTAQGETVIRYCLVTYSRASDANSGGTKSRLMVNGSNKAAMSNPARSESILSSGTISPANETSRSAGVEAKPTVSNNTR